MGRAKTYVAAKWPGSGVLAGVFGRKVEGAPGNANVDVGKVELDPTLVSFFRQEISSRLTRAKRCSQGEYPGY